jgi:hypothetical protein
MDECEQCTCIVIHGHSFCELFPVLQSYQVVTTSLDTGSFLISTLPIHMAFAIGIPS